MNQTAAGGLDDAGGGLWREACHRVLREVGRARLHDIRAVLNSVAVSAEVLHLTSTADPTPPVAGQMLSTIRHDLAAASAELSALEALVTQAAAPSPLRWPDAVDWAFTQVEPVARRRQIRLVAPAAVPTVPADDRAGLCLALALVEAIGTGVTGSECVMLSVTDPASLQMEWTAPPEGISDTLAPRLFAAVFGSGARWSRDGERQRLDLALVAHE